MDLLTITISVSLVLIGTLLIWRRHIPTLGRVKSPAALEIPKRSLEDQRLLVEAIASWTEGLRDAISGSSGIEQAIITTGKFAPEVIAPQVDRLVASLRYESVVTSLKRFSSEVGHPTCDFVVVALVTAAENQTRDLSQLLSHLSECARFECESYLRIWVSRARTRSSVRIIGWSVGVFVTGLFVFNRSYLIPYFSASGTVVALVIVMMFGVSLHWLRRIAQIQSPSRLFDTALSGA